MKDENLLAKLRDSIADAAEYVDLRWRQIARHHGWGQARHLAAYKGYGNRQNIWIRGRLLANQVAPSPTDDPNWWDNLRASFERFESDEVPDALISLHYGSQSLEVTTDAEGYYTATLARPVAGSSRVVANTISGDTELLGLHEIFNIAPNARQMIISDIDDTVIHTGISDLLQAARLTFLSNAKSRKPLAGAASLYQELVQSADTSIQPTAKNPIFYLSNSPWNLYDLLDDFLELNDFPAGPLLLRDLGIRASKNNHKPHTMRQLLQRFDDLPVILIGDSGESDALYYAALAREQPERIVAIYIRDVDPGEDSVRDQRVDKLRQASDELNIPFERVESSIGIAKSLASLDLLDSSAVNRITKETLKDQQRRPLTV